MMVFPDAFICSSEALGPASGPSLGKETPRGSVLSWVTEAGVGLGSETAETEISAASAGLPPHWPAAPQESGWAGSRLCNR